MNSDNNFAPPSFDARAAVVNRTHRVVRQRAQAMQARKRTVRDLILPCLICSTVLLLMANAVWSMGDDTLVEWESGLWKRTLEFGADAGTSMSVLLIWFLPLSVLTAAVILLRRNRAQQHGDEVTR